MDNSSISLAELESWKSTECFQRFLESQKELVHSQIDQLQNIVVTQCKLTGANPLSQEMAAGALSINIGKRPRDLLNPKAIKYMQSVFSIKDAVSKKESREISALCGVTVTQVREFFAGQRARVRKLARLSREKAVKSDACKISQDGSFPSSDTSFPVINPAPLNSVDPKATEEAPSCSLQGETIPGIDEADKTFVENIFNMMRREVTFSGQVKLMDWILQTQNSSVLNWFLNKGGLMILTSWLSDASLEEQTTVLLVIFKVLCHLPLHKALPMQMSAILQTVNRLRFYRTSDISNRAKVLLSRWSKMFVRNQALKKPSITNSSITAQKEKNLKQSSDMLGNEWQSNVDLPEEILHLAFKSSEDIRNSESSPATKLLTSSTDDSNKKQNRGVSSVQTRERRKVMPMEQPGRNNNSRNVQVARAIPSNQARPMSTDDIQKAKMRAIYMQNKYGKNGSSSSNENQQQKIGNLDKSSTSQTRHLLSAPKLPLRQKIDEGNSPKSLSSEPPSTLAEEEAPKVLASETSALSETPLGSKPSFAPPEPSWEKLKISQIPWHMPPEVRISSLWRVGVGEKSKEVEIQVGRIKREKETMYQRFQDVPPNPKEPWDLEIDHDDTLTPEIPTEQPPDPDAPEPQPEPSTTSYNVQNNTSQTHATTASATVIAASQSLPITTTSTTETAAEPDLELLAVLLKNPQLVFALTSGQGSNNLTSADTVKLLDLIKNSQVDLAGVLNGLEGDAQKVEEPVSLPSPTPPSERMNEWRPEVVKNSFSLPVPMGNSVNGFLQTSLQPILPHQEQQLLATAPGLQPQPQITNFSHPQLKTTVTVTPLTQQLPPVLNTGNFASRSNAHPFSDHLGPSQLHEAQQPCAMNSTSNQLLNQAQEGIMVHTGVPSLHHSEPLTYGRIQNLRPALIVQNPPKDRLPSTAPPHLQTLPPRRGMPQQHFPHEPQLQHLQWNALNSNSSSSSRQTHLPELIINRQKAFESSGSGSNPWSHSNQNNYNVFPDDAVRLSQPSWERDEYLDEPEFEMWSPERSPERSRSRSLEYRSGQSYSDSRRDSSRSSRTDWSRRRDSGRRDHRHGSSRRWRDNRRH